VANHLDNYINVKTRKKDFYLKYPDGRIISEAIEIADNKAIFKATIYKDFRDQKSNLPWSTGYAQEFKGLGGFANKHAWVENCEESAVGRALDNAGFATQCSKEEMLKVNVAEQSNKNKPQKPSKSNQEKEVKNPDEKVSIKYLKMLMERAEIMGYKPEDLKEMISGMFNIESSGELTNKQYDELFKYINNNPKKGDKNE
jgi:hypothetical protein